MSKTDVEIAPCLARGAFQKEAQELVSSSRAMGSSGAASVLRAMAIVHCFDVFERSWAAEAEPMAPFREALSQLTAVFGTAKDAGLGDWDPNKVGSGVAAESEDVKQVTGEHYGRLFEAFGDRSYWDEPKALLEQRLSRNEINPDAWRSKTVLDAGCGGGRYTTAWHLLGAGECVGVDVSKVGLENARKRVAQAQIDGVSFVEGDVLALPLEADQFDVVFSNGVLHHTSDWNQGVQELLRVLKPGGMGWLYLIENPGGLFWDMIELLRVIVQGEDRAVYRAALRNVGVPSNRIFYMLDHIMVPINVRLTPEEIEAALKSAGAKEIRRLTRGTDFDRVEQIHHGRAHAEAYYGVGENRFVFSK